MQFKYNTRAKEWRHIMEEDEALIRNTGKVAVKKTATLARDNARRNIASSGRFSGRWQKAMKFSMEKNPTDAIAAARVFHAIPFAVIFEEGGTIRGQPKLWVPIEKNVPIGVHSPREYVRKIGPLASVNHPGKGPLLVDKRRRVPVFVGVDQVHIRKRFAIYDAIQQATDHMGEFYVAALAAEDKK